VNPAGPACGSAGGACTSAQVAAHNTSGDCWVIYNTNYLILSGSGVVGSNGNEVTNHSGGSSRITPYCGGNATSAFTSKHGGQTSVKNIFNSYIVGPVQ
jgi:cytochrome b involved in lipid metabolism